MYQSVPPFVCTELLLFFSFLPPQQQLCQDIITFWLTPLSFEVGELLRTNPFMFFTRMREEDPSKAGLAELGLTIHACCATEMTCERLLGDVARLVGKDRASLNNASIMALLMFYLKKKPP
jgi:hypothetical protein